MKKETKAKAKTKAATSAKGKKAAESKPKAKAKKGAAKDMKLAEKYEAVTELFFKNEASAIIEKLKGFPFKSELYFRKRETPHQSSMLRQMSCSLERNRLKSAKVRNTVAS